MKFDIFLTIITLLFLGTTLTLINSSSATAKRNTAIIIGNSNYTNAPLPESVKNAYTFSSSLKSIGIQVNEHYDVNKSQFLSAIEQFTESSSHSNIGILYYSGHAIQIEGFNYLIPVNANFSSILDLKHQAVSFSEIINKLKSKDFNIFLLILDSFHDNPVVEKDNNLAKGLANVSLPDQFILAYASSPGTLSVKDGGELDIYTRYLNRNIINKDLSLSEILLRTGENVKTITENKQIPWLNSQPLNKVYFQARSSFSNNDPLESSKGQLTIHVTPNDATISFSDPSLEYSHGILLEPGSYELSIAAAGYKKRTRTVEISSGTSSEIEIVLNKAPISRTANLEGRPYQTADYFDPFTGMIFKKIKGGCFEMGDHCSHDSQQSDTPIHRVCVDDFHIGIYEVSQQEYQLVIDTNPSKGEVSIEKPVNSVSWYDAERFVQKLNKMSNTKYRLPTEAEWEYAASDRGVTMTFSGGEELDRVGWYKGNSSRSSHVRGTKQPNASGLYDMTGNVSEWCSDWWNFDYYKIGSRTNPKGPDEGELKVTRGGSWVDVESLSCIHLRRSEKPETRSSTLGFRLVLPHHY